MMTDGVLILEHTNSDKGIMLINPSLQKIFGSTTDSTSKRGSRMET